MLIQQSSLSRFFDILYSEDAGVGYLKPMGNNMKYGFKNFFVDCKNKCEYIIENYNAFFQAFLFLLLLYTSIYGIYLDKKTNEEIIINLLGIITMEFLIHSVKDSITQSKLNKLLVITKSINQLVPVSPEKLENFEQLISSTQHELLISGIACNNVWTHMNRIMELLDRGCHIKLLITGEESIEQNAKFYFGLNEQEQAERLNIAIEDIKNKINITLNILKLNAAIEKYYCDKKFEIRRSDQFISTVFVSIDKDSNRSDKVIKATHYTYGCKNTQACPSFLLTLPEYEHWFNYYSKIIDKQWSNAIPVVLSESCNMDN